MKTRKDAERAIELCNRRDDLAKKAGLVRHADALRVTVGTSAGRPEFEIVHKIEELRDLIAEEFKAEVAGIDAELRQLGIAPDEFEAAAPEAEDENTMQVVFRRAAASLPKYGEGKKQ
jgi:hypothetical protein